MAAAGPPKSRIPLLLGLGVVAGAGYYYYAAGGDPQAAKSQFEKDAEKTKEHAQATYDSIKASANSATAEGKQKFEETSAKLDAERKKAQTEIKAKIDEADKKIIDETKKASSWWGGSK